MSVEIGDIVNHPGQLLVDKKEMPSAFIPFCAFKGQLMGEKMENISFPVCTSFFPVTHNGQLCYQLNNSRLGVEPKGGSGVKDGLLLLLDINADRTSSILWENLDDLNSLRFDMSPAPKSGQAEIYIHTLSPFTGHGPGDYKMSVLKKTSSSEMFLDLPVSKKKCQIEKRETCDLREWFSSLRNQCKCIPYKLGAFKKQVNQTTPPIWSHFSLFPRMSKFAVQEECCAPTK